MRKMSLSEMITYSTVLIKCQYADGTGGSGTGFVINLCSDEENKLCVPVLITNNHVVANSVKTVFEFCKADPDAASAPDGAGNSCAVCSGKQRENPGADDRD